MKTLFALVALLALHTAAFAQATAEDLKKHMAALQAALAGGKVDEAAKITGALLPDNARLKKALADDSIAKAEAFYARLPKAPEQLGKLLAVPAARTEIQVHGATTEEIAKYAEGSTAHKEFPGAIKDLAAKGVLRPGITFYEVEFLEPGKDLGTKFHLFYHDGTAWTMLGPIWNALK
jgi:hypothetical protein